jgi:hypothetical protein
MNCMKLLKIERNVYVMDLNGEKAQVRVALYQKHPKTYRSMANCLCIWMRDTPICLKSAVKQKGAGI